MEPIVEVKRYRLIFALIASHGFTDLDSLAFVPIYALVNVLPLPPKLVFSLFLAFSLLHFSEDVGPAFSLLLHTTAVCLRFRHGEDEGFAFMMLYSLLVHIPCHVMRMIYTKRYFGIAMLSVFGCAFCVGKKHVPSHFGLTDRVQRVVISHILVEKAHALGWVNL